MVLVNGSIDLTWYDSNAVSTIWFSGYQGDASFGGPGQLSTLSGRLIRRIIRLWSLLVHLQMRYGCSSS